MNGHAVETVEHLLENGVNAAKSLVHEPQMHDLDASKLTVTLTKSPGKVPEPDSLEIWDMKTCTDHMVKVTWTDDVGWHAPTIEPYGQLTMSPIASCLHYATQCFEGMKVYRGFDGKLRLFRPDKNCARLVMSSARVALPTFDPRELEKLLKAFMKIDGPSKSLPPLFPCSGLLMDDRMATKEPPRYLHVSASSNHRQRRADRSYCTIRSPDVHRRGWLARSIFGHSTWDSAKAPGVEATCFQERCSCMAWWIRLCEGGSQLWSCFCEPYGGEEDGV